MKIQIQLQSILAATLCKKCSRHMPNAWSNTNTNENANANTNIDENTNITAINLSNHLVQEMLQTHALGLVKFK